MKKVESINSHSTSIDCGFVERRFRNISSENISQTILEAFKLMSKPTIEIRLYKHDRNYDIEIIANNNAMIGFAVYPLSLIEKLAEKLNTDSNIELSITSDGVIFNKDESRIIQLDKIIAEEDKANRKERRNT